MKVDPWKLLRVFDSQVRVAIVRLLLQFEWRSLTEIAERLESDYAFKMSLPGLLKHMKELEEAGIVRRESGVFAEVPDARKTMYTLQGKERVDKVLQQLESNVTEALLAGLTFNETAKLARKVQGMGSKMMMEDTKRLKFLLDECESQNIYKHLTEDERKKVKLWKMMIKFLEE